MQFRSQSARSSSRSRAVRRACLATLEALETRRLMADTGVLYGITGNQTNPDNPIPDETLYTIDYALPGTTTGPMLDGFADVPNAPDEVLSLTNAFGVTTPGGALRVDVPQGQNAFWGIQTPNIVDQLKAGATTFSYDMTLLNQELNGGSYDPTSGDDSFNGYAQSNEIAVVLAIPSGGFIQRNFAAGGATDSMDLGAQWSGQDGTRTITWDLTKFTDAAGTSLADLITANNATEAHIWLPLQGGDANGNQGPMRFYFDNFVVGGAPAGDAVIGDFNMVTIHQSITLPHVPDTDAIGFNPEDGMLYRVSGSSSYRNDPLRIGYHDNQFMEKINVQSPDLTQTGIFNANYEGENDRGTPTGPYGLPAPFPTWLDPDHRRTDEETDPILYNVQGPDEYHAMRDLTWDATRHLFIGTEERGLYTMTADGTSKFLNDPGIRTGGPKGITFFTVDGVRKLLVTERDGSTLWFVDPETGIPTDDTPVSLVDPSGNPIPGVLSLVESPDGKTLLGIGRTAPEDPNDDPDPYARQLLIIDPVTGQTSSLGFFGVHMADLAFVIQTEQPVVPAAISQVFVNGPGLTGQTSANGVAFRNLAGVDNTFGYPVPAGANQTKTIPWNGGIDRIALRFTQNVADQLQQADLVVRGSANATYAVSGFTYDAATKTGVWTLSTPITNDKVRLFLDDTLVGGLDGEWQNANASEAYPSGDGTAGGDFDFRFNVLRGDANQDGAVNALDLGQLKAKLNRTATNPGTGTTGYSVFADLNADGQINALDLGIAKARLNTRLPSTDPATALLFSATAISR